MLWITRIKDSTAKLCIYIGSNTKPTNRKENQMTEQTYDQPEPPLYIAPDVLVQQLTTKLSDLETKVSNYSNLVSDHRNKVRDLYTAINDVIQENQSDPDDTITFSELSEILKDILGNELVFTKEYEVQVRYTLYATFKVTAQSEEDARSIGEEIGISSDPDWDIDGENTEVDTWSIDDTRVDYVQEAR
jgi:hypothetical protein